MEDAVHGGADHHLLAPDGDPGFAGLTTGESCRQIGVTVQTYYRWHKEFGGMEVDH